MDLSNPAIVKDVFLVILLLGDLALRFKQLFSREPPLDRELAEYVKRGECKVLQTDLWARVNGDKKELGDKLDMMARCMSEQHASVLRAIGRLEGDDTRRRE